MWYQQTLTLGAKPAVFIWSLMKSRADPRPVAGENGFAASAAPAYFRFSHAQ
jgi:hypothetical protein